jgi:hypothetical protein
MDEYGYVLLRLALRSGALAGVVIDDDVFLEAEVERFLLENGQES